MATALLARADMKGFMLVEVVWGLTFLLLSLWLLPMGIEWVGLAYLASYVVYLGLLMWRIRKVHGISLPALGLLRWLVGFALVTFSSWLCWDDQALYSWHFVVIIPALLFSFLIMTVEERHFARQLLVQGFYRVGRLVARK